MSVELFNHVGCGARRNRHVQCIIMRGRQRGFRGSTAVSCLVEFSVLLIEIDLITFATVISPQSPQECTYEDTGSNETNYQKSASNGTSVGKKPATNMNKLYIYVSRRLTLVLLCLCCLNQTHLKVRRQQQ